MCLESIQLIVELRRGARCGDGDELASLLAPFFRQGGASGSWRTARGRGGLAWFQRPTARLSNSHPIGDLALRDLTHRPPYVCLLALDSSGQLGEAGPGRRVALPRCRPPTATMLVLFRFGRSLTRLREK